LPITAKPPPRSPQESGTAIPRAPTTCRPRSLRISASTSRTSSTSKREVVHFHSSFLLLQPLRAVCLRPHGVDLVDGLLAQVEQQVRDQLQAHRQGDAVRRLLQGFRDGGANSGFPASCYANGVPQTYIPDTLNNYELGWKTTSLAGHLVWNGAAYYMDWKNLQTLLYDIDLCAPSSFNANVGDARIYGVESNIDYKLSDHWSFQASAAYTDAHLVSVPNDAAGRLFAPNVGERLPYVPYFTTTAPTLRYRACAGRQPQGVRAVRPGPQG